MIKDFYKKLKDIMFWLLEKIEYKFSEDQVLIFLNLLQDYHSIYIFSDLTRLKFDL